jgi:hypothetical protein
MTAILDLCSDELVLKFRKGITIRSPFGYFSTDDAGVTYDVINLTGYTAILEATLPNSTIVLDGFNLTTENGGLTVEQRTYDDKNGVSHADAWVVIIYVPDTVTEAITWKKANYTLKLITPVSGDVVDFMAGRFEVNC